MLDSGPGLPTLFRKLRASHRPPRGAEAPVRSLDAPPSTISFSRVISSGPKVSGRSAPIFTPVQPFSLCEAVTIATAGQSSSNCAKYAIGDSARPMSFTRQPAAMRPAIRANLIDAE